jgi:hypothetical protein
MTHNPYSPPKTLVTDAPGGPPVVRPRVVVIAVALLWIEFTLNFVVLALDWEYQRGDAPMVFVIGLHAVFIALSALINYKIWQGRNWARIFALTWVLIGVAFYTPEVSSELTRAPAATSLGFLQLLLDLVALYLVFIPGRHWFTRR